MYMEIIGYNVIMQYAEHKQYFYIWGGKKEKNAERRPDKGGDVGSTPAPL